MMISVALVGKDNVVINAVVFEDEESFESFDLEVAYGEGVFGVILGEGMSASEGYTYEDGKFIAPPPPEPTHEQLVRNAENEKYERLAAADNIFLEWQTKLLLNIASEEEKQAVISWVKYKDEVRSVDTQKAPDIEWPAEPAIPDAGK